MMRLPRRRVKAYQADIVLQKNSGNLPAAAFDWLKPARFAP
jgi:hypothetical protein